MAQLLVNMHQSEAFPVVDLTGDGYGQFLKRHLIKLLEREFHLLEATLSLIMQVSSLEQEDRQKYELIEQQIRELSDLIEKLNFRISSLGQIPKRLKPAVSSRNLKLNPRELVQSLTLGHHEMIDALKMLDNALSQRPSEERMLGFLRDLIMKHELMSVKLAYGVAM